MNFLKLFFLFVILSQNLESLPNKNINNLITNKKNDYIAKDIGLFSFKGRNFQATKLIFQKNDLTLSMKFNLMEELLKICNKFENKDCLVFITFLDPEKLNDIEYCVSYLSSSKDHNFKMYFYKKSEDLCENYGLGKPIYGVSAEGNQGDFCYKTKQEDEEENKSYNDLMNKKIEYPKNDQDKAPAHKFPNFESYCKENYAKFGCHFHVSSKKDFSLYIGLKNRIQQHWKPSQIRTYNSAIAMCRAIMYKSYLKWEDVENRSERVLLINEECKPKMKLYLCALKDQEVSDFIFAEFEFWEWDLSNIDDERKIWSMTIPRNR